MQIRDTSIELKGLRFFAYHGALPHEQKTGNYYKVSLIVTFDATAVMRSDDLTPGINYADLYTLISEEMAIPSQLLEHVAHRILTHIGTQFPTVLSATVSITKQTPPIPGFHGDGITFSASASY